MKRIFLIVLTGSSLLAMQPSPVLKISQEKPLPPEIQAKVQALKALANLGKLPTEMAGRLLKEVALRDYDGPSNEQKLYNCASLLRILMRTCPLFYQFARDYPFNASLIDELAKKYTDGDRLKIAIFLSTGGAGHWLIENVILRKKTINGTYLRAAAVMGDLWQIKFILRYFPQLINDRGRLGMTPLMWAALYGHVRVVDCLLQFRGIDPNAVDDNGTSALAYACMNRQTAVVARLLEHGIDVNTRTTSRRSGNGNGDVWMHSFINQTRGQIVGNLQHYTWLPGHTALMFACELGDLPTVRLLAQASAINPNSGCNESWTPMGYANIAFSSNLREQDGGPALLRACARGNLELVKLLLSIKRVDVNGHTRSGNTALMEAVYHGHIEVVRVLLQQPDIDIHMVAYWPQAIEEITALKLARSSISPNKDAIIKLLQEHGAQE